MGGPKSSTTSRTSIRVSGESMDPGGVWGFLEGRLPSLRVCSFIKTTPGELSVSLRHMVQVSKPLSFGVKFRTETIKDRYT